MKTRRIIASLLALAALATGCTQEEELGPAGVSIESQTEYTFEADAQSFTVEFVATREWTATSSASWMSIQPKSGDGSNDKQQVEVTVLPNDSYDRTGTITISIGLSEKTVSVKQLGGLGVMDGSKTNPYNVEGALNLITSGNAPDSSIYVKGIVVTATIDTSYGNATYYISDDGTSTTQLEVYRGYGLGGAKFTSDTDLKAGDEVIVYGQVVYYNNSTPEFTTGSKIYSLNGTTKAVETEIVGTPSGDGSESNPYNVAGAQSLIKTLDADVNSSEVYVKGKIVTVTIDTSYGNATLYISDDGTSDGELEIFRCYYIGGAKFTSTDQLKAGDEIVVYGKLVNYKGNTPEMTSGGKIISVNGETGSTDDPDEPVGTPEGEGTAASPYNVAAAQQYITTLEDNVASTDSIYVKGIISTMNPGIDTSYGNATFYISDDGTTAGQLYIFRCYYIGGVKFASADLLKAGDEVVLCGKLIDYNGNTPEMTTGGKVISVNGSSDEADYFTVSPEAISVGSDAGSYTIKVNTNVDWTAESSSSDFVLSATSGNGSSEIVVTYGANTGSEAKEATITVSTTANVSTKSYTIAVKQLPAGSMEPATLKWSSSSDWTDESGNAISSTSSTIVYKQGTFTITIAKGSGTSNPTVNASANDARAYAKATVTVECSAGAMSQIVFNISSKGLARLAPITADCGTVATQASGDKTVTWTGSSSKVVFTVGEKADYGSDGNSKAGQLCFDSVDVQ